MSVAFSVPQTLLSYSFLKELVSYNYMKTCVYEETETKEKFLVKAIPKSYFHNEEAANQYLSKLEAFKAIKHPNLLTINDVVTDSENIYILTDYFALGNLETYLQSSGPFTEAIGRKFVRQLVNVIVFLQKENIEHRELSLRNLYITDDFRIVFSGLDLSPRTKKVKIVSTIFYSAPEIIKGQSYSQLYADMWSLGVVLYSVVCGRMPWTSGVDETVLMGEINSSSYIFPHSFSMEIEDLLNGLLESNPVMRFGPDEVRAHPWIKRPRRASTIPRRDRNFISCLDEECVPHMEAQTPEKPKGVGRQRRKTFKGFNKPLQPPL